jgi:hypothetical protein
MELVTPISRISHTLQGRIKHAEGPGSALVTSKGETDRRRHATEPSINELHQKLYCWSAAAKRGQTVSGFIGFKTEPRGREVNTPAPYPECTWRLTWRPDILTEAFRGFPQSFPDSTLH